MNCYVINISLLISESDRRINVSSAQIQLNFCCIQNDLRFFYFAI